MAPFPGDVGEILQVAGVPGSLNMSEPSGPNFESEHASARSNVVGFT